ncbi:MAG: hypothetical protein ACREEM_36945 [Blastocatellia bacterium]
MKKLLFILLLLCLSSNAFAQNKGVLLENLTWQEAEKALKPETVVVIPLGAAAKEHGPHLKLKKWEALHSGSRDLVGLRHQGKALDTYTSWKRSNL